LHTVHRSIHLEPGFSDETIAALERVGFAVRVWPEQHHYFGGVSVVARTGAAADPRRSGAAIAV
jgi:gamma-glutamyltranspeptidase/glutathione hydrolase